MGDEIDSRFTDEVTCPWCGYEFSDSWEWPDNSDEDCPDCGKEFFYEREIEVTYSSYKKDKENE